MENKTVVLVNATDNIGGAAQSSWKLHKGLLKNKINSYIVVSYKSTKSSKVLSIHRKHPISYLLFLTQFAFSFVLDRVYGLKHLIMLVRILIEKYKAASKNIYKLPHSPPDIIHANNLHRHYFSLYSLPYLSNKFPFVYTLHDTWSFTGHCAHYLDCHRWQSGCGECPYLSIYPAMSADYTKYYWKLKQKIYKQSKFFLVTPSKWLMDNALNSILKPAIQKYKVIPNGINLDIFYPAEDKKILKQQLGFKETDKIVLFVAAGINSPFKDYKTVRDAVTEAAATLNDIIFIAIGDNKNYTDTLNNVHIKHIKYEKDPNILANYYRASDLFLHGAKADNLPGVVIEALACGTPVVATNCGGIPEIINGFKYKQNNDNNNSYTIDRATGILTKLEDSQDMAEAIIYLMQNDTTRTKLGENAAKDAKIRFPQELCTKRYIEFYKEASENH